MIYKLFYITSILLVSALTGIVILNSCNKKKQCTGTNSISGVLKDGTTNLGIKNVQLEIQIYDYNYSKDKGENYKTLCTVTIILTKFKPLDMQS